MRALKLFAISFISAALVFGLVSYLIISNSFEGNESPADSENTDQAGETDFTFETDDKGDPIPPESKNSSVSFLFIGTDYQPDVFDDYDYSEHNQTGEGFPMKERAVSADSILLIKIDKEQKKFLFTSIPSNVLINRPLNKTLAELYDEKGADYVVECVYALTGIRADHTAVIGMKDCIKALDKLGDITYNVPCNMNYVDESQNLEINLTKGVQTLSAEQVVSMLRYNSFDSSVYTRESVMVEFAQSLFKKLTSKAYLSQSISLFKELVTYFETEFDVTDFAENMDLIFSYPEFSSNTVTYPGYEKEVSGKTVFVAEIQRAVSMYADYK